MIDQLPIGLLDSNCYLVYDHEGGDGAIVDPGVPQPNLLLEAISRRHLRIRYILNTHGHFDHVLGLGSLALPEALVAVHPRDRDLLVQGGGTAQFGLPVVRFAPPDLDLTDGTVLTVDGLRIEVIHTPGHTLGSVCLYVPTDGALITGDTLFAGSVGRTDLLGGDPQMLALSLKRILELPDQTLIYPGHGNATTLVYERRHNPWLQVPI